MNTDKFLPLAKGIIKCIPGVEFLLRKRTGGTTLNSRYCYSVWLRHLIQANIKGLKGVPKTIAELGPGDSTGIGLAALLSGAENYYALDVIKYWDAERNIKVLDELIELFKKHENVPDNNEFPEIKPFLDSYAFPADILTEEILIKSLSEERIDKIRRELTNSDESDKKEFIFFFIPWDDPQIIKNNSIDFIFSQAVLEHVEDLEKTYKAMNNWLKLSGMMSHTIDLKSHGTTKSWDGCWTFSNYEWEIVKGRKKFFINRYPYTAHVNLHEKYGFNIINIITYNEQSTLEKRQLAENFNNLNQQDLNTAGIFIQSEKKIYII